MICWTENPAPEQTRREKVKQCLHQIASILQCHTPSNRVKAGERMKVGIHPAAAAAATVCVCTRGFLQASVRWESEIVSARASLVGEMRILLSSLIFFRLSHLSAKRVVETRWEYELPQWRGERIQRNDGSVKWREWNAFFHVSVKWALLFILPLALLVERYASSWLLTRSSVPL